MTRKKLDLGEYVIKITYDEQTSELNVDVLDEGGEVIESINIQDDNSEEDDDEGFCLN
jgi:hypothetical protein